MPPHRNLVRCGMFRSEPVAVALAGLDAAVVAVLSALMVLGWVDLTGEQLAAISAALVAVTGLIGSVLRRNVVSPATHEREVLDAWVAPAPPSDPTDLSDWPGDV